MKDLTALHRTRFRGLAAGLSVFLCLQLTALGTYASETAGRELSPAAPASGAETARLTAVTEEGRCRSLTPCTGSQAQLEKLTLRAALLDSSMFGQLRILREPSALKGRRDQRRARATDACADGI